MGTDKTKENYKHSDLTDAIIGAFYEVYNELGFGFLESVYVITGKVFPRVREW